MVSQIQSFQKFPSIILKNGIIIGYNDEFLILTGKNPRSVLGKPFTKFIEHSILSEENLITPNYYLFFDESRKCYVRLSNKEKIAAFLDYYVFDSKDSKLVHLVIKPTNLLFKQNEELERYIHFYKQIAEVLPDIAFIQLLNLNTNKTRFLYVNSVAEEVFGFTFEEIQAIEAENEKAFFQYIHPEDRDDHMYIVEEATQRRNIFSRVMKMFTKDREVRYLYVNTSLFPINEEEVLSFGVARDITQLIRQQKYIEEQKEVLQSLSDISNQLISSFGTNLDRIADLLAHHIETSHFLLYLEPFDDQEHLLRARGIKAPDIEQHIHQIYQNYSTKEKIEIEFLPEDITRKILHEKDLQLFFVPVLNENKFWGFFIFSKGIDYRLTKEKIQFLQQLAFLLSLYLIQYESHIALENQFNTFSQILNAVEAVVVVTDTETGEIYFHNNKFNLLLGSNQYSDQKKIAKLLKEIIQNNLHEFYLQETDKWYKIYSSKINWFRQGNLDLIIIVDITDLKRNSQDLENTKNLIETLVNNTPAGIMHLDTDGKLLYINDTYLKILNLNMNDIKHFQKAFNSVFELPSLKKAGLVDDLKTVINKGKTVERALWLETLKGETKYMHYVMAPLKSKGGQVQSVIWVGQDLTTLKQMEEERQRIDLLNSMGLFSAGIAHDFNNLLTGIIGNLSLARILIERQKYEKLKKLIHQAELSAEKSRDLTYQLLNFARGGVPVKGTAQAHKIIKNLTGLIFSGSAVQIFYKLHAKNDIIDINKVQFEQVLNNLLTNAYQAMNGDGNLTIKTWNEKIEPKANPFVKEGNYFVFEIRDTGIGIDKKYISKIFDPFFTTKSYGSGLGLATVYSIINKSNGNIFVSSKKGEGTTFKVYLPLADTLIEEEEERTSDVQKEIKPIKSARILFLDDEEYICNIVNEILTNIGQEVVTVHRGEEAIREFKTSLENKKKFDVIILDLTIKGGLGGVETFEELKKLDPDIKAILTTGYTDEETIRKFKELGFSKVLQKPFTFDQLIQVIQEHLEEE